MDQILAFKIAACDTCPVTSQQGVRCSFYLFEGLGRNGHFGSDREGPAKFVRHITT